MSLSIQRLDRGFFRHYVEMLFAMLVGMAVLGPLWPDLADRLEVQALVMATNMSLGMAALMAARRHPLGRIAEMTLAMYVPFVVLFPPYWLGTISGGTLLVAGHLLMLPAMAIALLHRREHQATDRPHRLSSGTPDLEIPLEVEP